METGRRIAYRDYLRTKGRRYLEFSSEEIQIGKKYLKNPTNAGLWRLDAQWMFDCQIANEIKDIITKNAPKLKINRRKISVSSYDLDSLLLRTESISFYLRLFNRLVRLEDDSDTLAEYIDETDEDGVIISLLDLEGFAVKYKAALACFKKEIYTPDSFLKVGRSHMTRIKNGSFICVRGPKDLRGSIYYQASLEMGYRRRTEEVKDKIELISLSHAPLNNLVVFFDKLQLINDVQKYAVFSPEEEVLGPYVDILSAMMQYLTPRDSDSQFFTKMISDYNDRNYTGCISTAGLIVEDCLTQIYETIYRIPVPRKMTLGSLKEKIGEAAKNRDSKELGHDDVFKLMAEYKARNSTDPIKITDLSSKLLLRYIDEKYKKIDLRIDSIEGEAKNSEFFPFIIRVNLEDIIRYRNAVSHKSLDPVGSFEALKSIYCSLSLVVWWDEEKKKVDWTRDQKEIVRQFVQAAKTYMG